MPIAFTIPALAIPAGAATPHGVMQGLGLLGHYHQSYQVRHFSRTVPNFMLEPAGTDYPMIHLFDEPQFNTQDGYIGFMLDFFHKLRSEGRLVFVCLHPNEPFQLEIMQEICERYIFVQNGKVSEFPDFESLITGDDAKMYLGNLVPEAA